MNDAAKLRSTEQASSPFAEWAVIRALRRNALVVGACLLIAPIAAYVHARLQPKQYSASAMLLFQQTGFDQTAPGVIAFPGSGDATVDAATDLGLVNMPDVAAAAAPAAQLPSSELLHAVSVTPQGSSDLVTVTATLGSPTLAAHAANAFASAFVRVRTAQDRSVIQRALTQARGQLAALPRSAAAGGQGKELRSQITLLSGLLPLQTGNVEVTQRATPPSGPSSPTPTRDALLALLLGAILGIALALIIDRLSFRLRDLREAELAFPEPVLGVIPASDGLRGPRFTLPPHAPDADAFGTFRAKLRYLQPDRPMRALVVTSAGPADGKTTVAVNLAMASAAAGQSVLLVDADMRRPTIAGGLGMTEPHGLSELLTGQADFFDIARRVEIPGGNGQDTSTITFDVVPAGVKPPNPASVIDSLRLDDLLQAHTSHYDLVIFDTPPLAAVGDAIPLARRADGVAVVCRMRHTRRSALAHLHRQLIELNAPILGLVLNDVSRADDYYGDIYPYYSYTAAHRSGRTSGARWREGTSAQNGSSAPESGTPRPTVEPLPEPVPVSQASHTRSSHLDLPGSVVGSAGPTPQNLGEPIQQVSTESSHQLSSNDRPRVQAAPPRHETLRMRLRRSLKRL